MRITHLGTSLVAVLVSFGVIACDAPDTEDRSNQYAAALDARTPLTPDTATADVPVDTAPPEDTTQTEDATEADGSGTPDTTPVGPPDITGRFLFALSSTISRTKPILFDANVEFDADTGTMSISLMPIKTDLDISGASPVPRADRRTPAAENPIVVDNASVTDGTFSFTLTRATVPGDANPVTGRDIVADLTVNGQVKSADFFCGDINPGTLIEPFAANISTSTFAATRTDDVTITDFVYRCP